jgi:hypothetical protein
MIYGFNKGRQNNENEYSEDPFTKHETRKSENIKVKADP